MPSLFCPLSKQPELKHAAVRVEAAALPWALVAAAWLPAAEVMAVRERLRALTAALPFVSWLPFGREPNAQVGLLLRAAAATPADGALLAAVGAELQLANGPVLRYADARHGRSRSVRLAADGSLQAFLLAGDAAAAPWLLDWLQKRRPAAALGRRLLAAGATPPLASVPRSPQVCACHDVNEDTVVHTLAALQGDEAARLAALQAQLHCGTECGSCLPAVKALVRRERQPLPTS